MHIYISNPDNCSPNYLQVLIDLAKTGKPLTVPVSFKVTEYKVGKDYLPFIMNLTRQAHVIRLIDVDVSDVVLDNLASFAKELCDDLTLARFPSEEFNVNCIHYKKEGFGILEVSHSDV